MKKIIIGIAIVAFSISNYAQTSVFDKFEEMNDVTTVVVTKEAFKMASKFGGNSPEAKDYMDMVKGLNNLKVYTTESTSIAKQMNDVVNGYLKSSKLIELMRVKDKDANVKIYVKPGKDDDHVSELLMFVSDMTNRANQESVILSLTGDIDLNKIAKLTEGYIPNSGKQLKRH
ncbi:DUF4252 domain-containing protein [Lutibacter sp.]|uniref:DUF4252 domain-containing protein n=1 Tax=Lutibacter sp. TaxID=1925666 RepID=UPI0035644952